MPNSHSHRQSTADFSGKHQTGQGQREYGFRQGGHSHADDAAAYAASGQGPEQTFAQLGVPGPLVAVLARDGKTTAFPIQSATLPDSLAGKDILGRGETGSGKTLAFSVPLVARLSGELSDDDGSYVDSREASRRHSKSKPAPRAMVLAPTRELVNQIDEVIAPLAAAYDMTTATIYGGVKYSRQIRELRAGAEIIVACPGRLEDLLRQGELTLAGVEVSVLDEADEMADMGFLPSVTRLLEQVKDDGQRMLFSATLDHGVDKVVKRFLHNATVHEIAPANAQVNTMTHHVFEVSQGNKYEVIRELASGKGKRLLFTRTKYQAKKMADKLVHAGIPAVDLQGNLSQNQRDRHLAAFSEGQVRVMVATDVAARGIDVSDVELVVQTEPPEDPKSFLHRSGRTARAGESGDVVTLVLPSQRRDARRMLQSAGIKAKSHEVVPGSSELEELVGEHAPLVEGWTLTVPVVNKKAGRTGRGGRSGRNRNSAGHAGRGARNGYDRGEEHEGRRQYGNGRNNRGENKYGDGRRGNDKYDRRRSSDRPTRGSRGGSRARGGWDDENQPFEGRTGRGGSGRGGHGRGGNPRYAGGQSSRSGGRHNNGGHDQDERYGHEYGQGRRASGGFHHGKNKKRNAAPFRRNGR